MTSFPFRWRFGAGWLLLAATPLAAAKPVVAVSVAPLAGIVDTLAGGAVETAVLVPPGTDVETYAPTPREIARLERASLVVRVGMESLVLEQRYFTPWLERHPAVPELSLAALRASAASRASGDAHDPHLWMSPRLVRALVGPLAERLSALVPADSAGIRERAARFDREIESLDRELSACFGPLRGARFLVYHPSLGALASDYGLVQVGLEAEGKEPTPRQLAARIREARLDRFPAVLVQPSTPRRSAEIVAREVGAELITVDPLAPDWLANLRRIADAIVTAAVPADSGASR